MLAEGGPGLAGLRVVECGVGRVGGVRHEVVGRCRRRRDQGRAAARRPDPAAGPVPRRPTRSRRRAACSSTSTRTSEATVADLTTPEGQEHLARFWPTPTCSSTTSRRQIGRRAGSTAVDLCPPIPAPRRDVDLDVRRPWTAGPLARVRADRVERRRMGVPEPGCVASSRAASAQAVRRAVRLPCRRVRRAHLAGRLPASLRTGHGQAVDVSEQEAVAAMLEMNLMHWTYAGRETSRLGSRAVSGRGSSPTASTARSSPAPSRRSSGSASSSSWATRSGRARRSSGTDWRAGRTWTSCKLLMDDWLGAWKVDDLYRAAQAPPDPVRAGQQHAPDVRERAPARPQVLRRLRPARRRAAPPAGRAVAVQHDPVVAAAPGAATRAAHR